jgi:hypothetical protein
MLAPAPSLARNLLRFYIMLSQKAEIVIGCILQSNYGYASLLESWKQLFPFLNFLNCCFSV